MRLQNTCINPRDWVSRKSLHGENTSARGVLSPGTQASTGTGKVPGAGTDSRTLTPADGCRALSGELEALAIAALAANASVWRVMFSGIKVGLTLRLARSCLTCVENSSGSTRVAKYVGSCGSEQHQRVHCSACSDATHNQVQMRKNGCTCTRAHLCATACAHTHPQAHRHVGTCQKAGVPLSGTAPMSLSTSASS